MTKSKLVIATLVSSLALFASGSVLAQTDGWGAKESKAPAAHEAPGHHTGATGSTTVEGPNGGSVTKKGHVGHTSKGGKGQMQ